MSLVSSVYTEPVPDPPNNRGGGCVALVQWIQDSLGGAISIVAA
jgi:hypothetical protein